LNGPIEWAVDPAGCERLLFKLMRERDREINRRRHRYHKRKKLRLKLGAAGAEAEQQKIEARIRKTYPSYTPAS